MEDRACVSVSKWINEAFNKLSYDNPVAKKISYLVNIHIHTHIHTCSPSDRGWSPLWSEVVSHIRLYFQHNH